MDQETRAPVSDHSARVPSGMPGANGGDAGQGADLRTELDQLLEKRLKTFSDDIAKAAANAAVRDTQRFVDARFSKIEPVLGHLVAQQQQVNRHFQVAEEADLPADERNLREMRRQLEDSQRQVQTYASGQRQWAAYAQVMRVLNRAGMTEDDPRVVAIWNAEQMQQNPEAWATDMATQIAQIKITEGQERIAQFSTANQEQERRRQAQAAQAAAVREQNTRRGEQAGEVETGIPGGPPRDWHERYMSLKNAGRDKEARLLIEAYAKRAARGEVRDPNQL